jgi:GNAT superfamily N-acetyltransferase
MEVRRLRQDEMAAAAFVHREAFDDRLPWLAGRYTPAEDTAYFTGLVFRECQVWGTLNSGRLVGIIAFRIGWIEHLYVLPSSQGVGVGASLLAIPKAQQPRLRLWTFQRNLGARAFYERRGFVAVVRSDGSRNAEQEPDILYEWRAESL